MSIGGLVTLWAAFIIYTAGAASAQPYYREVITDINQLTTQAGSTGQYVTVTCYYSTSTLCAGGGDFDQVGTSCSPNGATIFQNIHTNQCFFRKNFGVNGVADARQCGIHGDGATDDTTLLNNCMTIAASLQVPVVNTGGGRVLAISDNVSIPATVELPCSGPPGGQRPQ